MSAEKRRMRFWRDRNSLFLLVCPRRIFDNQRVVKTEKGSDLTIYGAPFFCIFPVADTPSGFLFPLFGDDHYKTKRARIPEKFVFRKTGTNMHGRSYFLFWSRFMLGMAMLSKYLTPQPLRSFHCASSFFFSCSEP